MPRNSLGSQFCGGKSKNGLSPVIKQYDEDIKNVNKAIPDSDTAKIMTGYVKALRSVRSGLCEILGIEIDEE